MRKKKEVRGNVCLNCSLNILDSSFCHVRKLPPFNGTSSKHLGCHDIQSVLENKTVKQLRHICMNGLT